MGRRLRPLRSLRRRVTEPVRRHPAPRKHPACMPDHAQTMCLRLPARSACQHLQHALAATGLVMQEVIDPGVDLGARNVRPRLTVPGAEIGLQQGVVDHMPPAQPAQVASHRTAAIQRRGADQAGQAVLERMLVDAAGQAPGLAWVDAQVGAADAEAGSPRWAGSASSAVSSTQPHWPGPPALPDLSSAPASSCRHHLPCRPRMAPGDEALGLSRHGHGHGHGHRLERGG